MDDEMREAVMNQMRAGGLPLTDEPKKAALWVPWERVETLLDVGNQLADHFSRLYPEATLPDSWDKARYKVIPQPVKGT